MSEDGGPQTDLAQGFTIPARHVRGRMVRLGPVLDDVLSAHAYPPLIAGLLAEALSLACLLGSMLKESGDQLTLQAQTENGPVRLLVADYLVDGEGTGHVRGYADFDADALAMLGGNPSLFGLFGKGFLAITFDRAKSRAMEGGRYQGIVPLEGESLAAAAEHYFAQSEQIPSFVRISIAPDADGWVAGGVIIQHLPEGEVGRERLHVRHDHPEWEHVQILATTVEAQELTDAALSPSELLWRLFHEEDEVRITGEVPLVKGCRCNVEHYRQVLGRFSLEERREMADEAGNINVDCAFCSRIFPVSLASLNN